MFNLKEKIQIDPLFQGAVSKSTSARVKGNNTVAQSAQSSYQLPVGISKHLEQLTTGTG